MEMQECLKRLKSVRTYGGDTFFAGLVQTFVASPVMPQAWNQRASI